MKRIGAGLLGGTIYTCMYYLITYLFLFVLGAPGDGFLATFLSIAILGTVIELLVAGVGTGISGMIALTIIEYISPDSKFSSTICGIIVIIAAIICFIALISLGLSLWYVVIFGGFMLLSGVKILLTAE